MRKLACFTSLLVGSTLSYLPAVAQNCGEIIPSFTAVAIQNSNPPTWYYNYSITNTSNSFKNFFLEVRCPDPGGTWTNIKACGPLVLNGVTSGSTNTFTCPEFSSATIRLSVTTSGGSCTGGTTCSYTSGPLVLPVTLLEWAIVNKGSEYCAYWKVEKEERLKQYELQYSEDGLEYTTLLTKSAINAGNATYNECSNSIKHAGYYRLKLVEINGHLSYTHTIKLQVERGGFSILPNLANAQFVIQCTEPARVEIYSVWGNKVYMERLSEGAHSISSASWPAGLYTVRMIGANGSIRYTEKLTIVH